jgi:two-component system CheB/CheR fusion protein
VVKSHDVESPLRFWVCGCATGEEAYSLAICLVEFFDQVRQHRPVQIFASDITEPGIARARTGIYPENIVQDVSPERLRRFFTKTDGRYQVSKSIREMVIFARQNVAMDPPFSNLDLITCRNVLIYLGPILQRKVLPLFHHALRPTGYLMLGSSETVGGSADLFRIVDKKHRIYSKKHSTRPMIYEPSRKFKPHVETPASARSRPRLSGEAPEADLPGYVDKLLLREFSPAAVVVNSELEVLQFRGRTSDFLEHPSGTATLNVLRMAREGIALDLRAAISKALKQKVPVKQSSHLRREGQLREFTIEIIPFQPSTDAEHFLLIIFKETGRVTQVETSRDNKGRAVVRDARELDRTRAELVSTRDTLQTIIEEQESNNEELRCANEEIQSSNEELQSTNEELETAKEELQSTNEELTTLNEELQTRNQELGVVLDDLTNLLASAHMAIIILDANLNIRRCTPLAERMFNMIPADIGRRLSDLNRPLIVPDLDDSIHKVINTLVPIERDVQDREGRWYSLRIRPYRTRENHIAGAVLVLIDIDQLKRALELLLNTAKEPLLTLGPDLTVRKANESFYKTFRLKPEQTEGRQIHEVGDGQWDQLKFHELLENVLPKDKQVHDFPMESTFPEIGRRKLLVNARRFYDEGWGVQIILLAIEDVTDKPEPQA